MKWLRTLILFDRGGVGSSEEWSRIHASYVRSIGNIDFPLNTGTLILRRKSRLPNGQWNRNGVVYLKNRFVEHMVGNEGWQPEFGFKLDTNQEPTKLRLYPNMKIHSEPITSEFGNFDFVTRTTGGLHVAIEWETGNISSSHRSMNKLAIALTQGDIDAGVLVVPSRGLYEHLTDRVGNIGELSGYLSMWQRLGRQVTKGLLAITVVEHDALTDDESFPYLPVGTDGRAREGAAKRD